MGFFDKAKDAIKEVLAPPASSVRPPSALPAPAAVPELASTPVEPVAAVDDPPIAATPETPEPVLAQGRLQVYTVKSGDTLAEIAERYGVEPMDIARLNHMENPERVLPGMVLKIPATG